MKTWIGVVIALVLVGCTTLDNGSQTVDAYRIGRIAAVGYLAVEENSARKEAVRTAWLVFNDALDALEGQEEVPEYLRKLLRQQIEDDTQYMLAAEAVDTFWNELTNRVSLDELPDAQVIVVLQNFRRGVADALLEYGGVAKE